MAVTRPEGFPEGAILEAGKWYKTQGGKVVKVEEIFKFSSVFDEERGWGYARCSDGKTRVVGNEWIGRSSWSEDSDLAHRFIYECNENGTPIGRIPDPVQLDLFS